jgi:hypothetical protein
MSRSSKSMLLEEEIALLVRHFGIERVRSALARLSIKSGEEPPAPAPKTVRPRGQRPIRATTPNALEAVRESDPGKHRLLAEFLSRLKNRQILPESQDIRHFAQIIGLKDIGGKSRKALIPKLMRFLIDQPVERLTIGIESANNISEQQRQMGFSVLTDKLLNKS